MLAKLRKLVLKIFYPFIKFSGKIHLPTRRLGSKEYHDVLKVIKKGDTLTTRQDWAFTNLLIPGFYKHTAIYIGDVAGEPMIVEAIGTGVQVTSLLDFMRTKDHIWIGRAKFCSEEQSDEAAEKSKDLVGKKYDFAVISNNDAFYCSEVVWWAYDQVIQPSPFEPRETWGEKTITPQDFSEAKNKWEMIYENKEE